MKTYQLGPEGLAGDARTAGWLLVSPESQRGMCIVAPWGEGTPLSQCAHCRHYFIPKSFWGDRRRFMKPDLFCKKSCKTDYYRF